MKWLTFCNKNPSLLIVIAFSLIVSGCATNETVVKSLQKVDQNVTHYAELPEAHYTIKPDKQKSLEQDFIKHYFSPWDDLSPAHTKKLLKSMKQDQLDSAEMFQQYPGWASNSEQHSTAWIQTIVTNMDLAQFPRFNRKAITVHDSVIRGLPTTDPSFDTKDAPGHCYPFDNLQESYLPASTPVQVLHASKDGQWYLIRTSSYVGWTLQQNIAFVDRKFINHWKTGHYIVPVRDTANIRIGEFFPLRSNQDGNYQILVAGMGLHQQAVTQLFSLGKSDAQLFPVFFSPQNMAAIANRMIGNPYGWGGLYGYRDCSATLQDLFIPFGIWLPRNSGSQPKQGKLINLRGLSDAAKEKIVMQRGIPFLTLIHIPGHIMLYIGKENGTAYVFHDMWGLHTKRLFACPGRAVVGKTVVTPIDFGKSYVNVPRSLLRMASGVILLASPYEIQKST